MKFQGSKNYVPTPDLMVAVNDAVPPLIDALLMNEQDVSLFEKLVVMQRHNR